MDFSNGDGYANYLITSFLCITVYFSNRTANFFWEIFDSVVPSHQMAVLKLISIWPLLFAARPVTMIPMEEDLEPDTTHGLNLRILPLGGTWRDLVKIYTAKRRRDF